MEKKHLRLTFIRMRRIIFSILFYFIFLTGLSDQATRTYTSLAIDAALYNPERGFYAHTETDPNPYYALTVDELTGYKTQNYSLILRVFYLQPFLTSNISTSYLNSIENDLNITRQVGLKCILRFAYSNDETLIGSLDASKTQMLKHIEQLKPIFTKHADVIYVLQAGFIGTWGEWYYTDNFGTIPLSSTATANRKAILDAILAALPKSRMTQLRTPYYKTTLFSNNLAITRSEAFNQNNSRSRVGHHNDCFLASSDDWGTYQNVAVEYPYLANETLYLPMGGETCNPNPPRSSCTTALAELEKFHWSYLNVGYHPDVINGFKTGGCFKKITSRLGYRFQLINGTYPDTLSVKQGNFSIDIKLKNVGFASLFNQRNVFLVLRESTSLKEYSIKLQTDPRFWLSNFVTTIKETVSLPSGIVAGSYKLYLNLPDFSTSLSTLPVYSIRLAHANLWETKTGYNSLSHSISITA